MPTYRELDDDICDINDDEAWTPGGNSSLRDRSDAELS
jgi:hypothetical protein